MDVRQFNLVCNEETYPHFICVNATGKITRITAKVQKHDGGGARHSRTKKETKGHGSAEVHCFTDTDQSQVGVIQGEPEP